MLIVFTSKCRCDFYLHARIIISTNYIRLLDKMGGHELQSLEKYKLQLLKKNDKISIKSCVSNTKYILRYDIKFVLLNVTLNVYTLVNEEVIYTDRSTFVTLLTTTLIAFFNWRSICVYTLGYHVAWRMKLYC